MRSSLPERLLNCAERPAPQNGPQGTICPLSARLCDTDKRVMDSSAALIAPSAPNLVCVEPNPVVELHPNLVRQGMPAHMPIQPPQYTNLPPAMPWLQTMKVHERGPKDAAVLTPRMYLRSVCMNHMPPADLALRGLT